MVIGGLPYTKINNPLSKIYYKVLLINKIFIFLDDIFILS